MPDVASCCQLSRVCCRGRVLAGAAAAQLGSQQSAWAWQYLYFGCCSRAEGSGCHCCQLPAVCLVRVCVTVTVSDRGAGSVGHCAVSTFPIHNVTYWDRDEESLHIAQWRTDMLLQPFMVVRGSSMNNAGLGPAPRRLQSKSWLQD